MIEDAKDPWGLVAKIVGICGGAALMGREALRIWRSPAQSREHTEQHYSEIFLEEMKTLRADIRLIREEYEARIAGYRKQIHEANNRALKYLGHLAELGYELDDAGGIVKIRIEKL